MGRGSLRALPPRLYPKGGMRMSSRSKALKSLRHDLKRDWQMYIFLIIPIIYIIIFAYFPIGGLQIAFRKYSARKGM